MAEPRQVVGIIGGVVAVALLWALLALPNQPGVLTPKGLVRFPLELPALVLLLLAAPPRLLFPLRTTIAVVLAVTTLLKLADLATETAFRRPFNPVLDGELVPAGLRLASGTFGWPAALAAALGLVGLTALVALTAGWASGRVAGLARPGWRRPSAALALVAFVAAAADAGRWLDPPGHARTGQMAWEHARDAARARTALADLRAEAARDEIAEVGGETLLGGLRGTDVFLVFVESYGRSVLEAPRYAAATQARLTAIEDALADAGLAARSGFLTAPMVGGQSWLAHASLLSGLEIGDQGRYRALIASPRRTLLHLAQAAGWTTAAVMPAIVLAWPESRYFGYDRVLAAADLGYRGPPFDWVTMPDQFTLAAFEREMLGPAPRAPVFAEIALISSHAPWTPLPTLVPWDAVGDGSVFAAAAASGEPAKALWSDPEKVRGAYARAIDYALQATGSFAVRRAPSAPLFVVLGDHQPVDFVSGDPTGRDVPIHVIGPPALLDRLDGWGWTPGMIPDPAVPAWPMAAFRDRFLAAFAGEAPTAALATP